MRNLQNLIESMSLKEKLAEISQLCWEFPGESDSTVFMGIDYQFEVDKQMEDNIGSILGLSGARLTKAAQNRHLETSRLNIPLIFMHDIIHGYKTVFPSSLAMSCTWQPELVKKSAEIAAKEASVSGLHLTFSPMCDLARDARWGRVVETSGEDVYLNSLFAKAYVEGYQGDDVSSKFKLASCAKHFAAYGMAESGREYNTTEVSERTLREHHLPAYKAAVDAGAKMVMTAFNALNGVPCSANKWLFEDILRGEWGFAGAVISDCTAIVELIAHGFAEDDKDAACKAIDVGVDIEMVSTTYYNNAEKLIHDGKLTIEQIDKSVLRVLTLKEGLGLFDNPYKDADEELEVMFHLCDEHRLAAREIARESMVLLKNEGMLPLEVGARKVALIGPLADSKQMLDAWAVCGDEDKCETLKEALSKHIELQYARGCGVLDGNAAEMNAAIALAKKSDIVILALGEEPLMSGESGSRMDINVPRIQMELAEKIFALGKSVAVVLYNGRPLAIPELDKKADAILEAWLPGTEGNGAVSDILLGKFSPSGRLTMSFPYSTGQCPIYYNRYSTGRPPKDIYHSERFTARYTDGPCVPLYPFGFGLSYSKFEYGEVVLSSKEMKQNKNEIIKATCKIKNIGKVSGVETVQLYLQDIVGSLVRPIRMLKGFERVALAPMEEKLVSFCITEEMLRFYTAQNEYASETGKFRVFIAPNAAAEECAGFMLVE